MHKKQFGQANFIFTSLDETVFFNIIYFRILCVIVALVIGSLNRKTEWRTANMPVQGFVVREMSLGRFHSQ